MTDYDVAVIGAGVFGAWTAWHLCREGQRVLLLDAWGAGHSRSSSGGESRIIRMGYGADEIYTKMAMRSLELWRDFDIFVRTGVLWIAREGEPYSVTTLRTLAMTGVPFEALSAAELTRRWPQIHPPDRHMFGIFEPGSGALLARRAVQAVVRDAISRGVEYRTQAVQPPVDQVRTVSGELLRARQFVFACGPWLPKMFQALLAGRIWPTRQEVFFFAPPAGDNRFAPGALPVWIDFTYPLGPYGFPDLEAAAVNWPSIAMARLSIPTPAIAAWPGPPGRTPPLLGSLSSLGSRAVTESRVCQYENTSSGDFLIDRHPDHDHFWLVGGGSGHGFKHGPAVGEYLAGRILRGTDPEPRFSLASKAEEQRRAVY